MRMIMEKLMMLNLKKLRAILEKKRKKKQNQNQKAKVREKRNKIMNK